MDPTIILSICIAGAVTGIVFFVLRMFAGEKDAKLINRLQEKQAVDSKAEAIAKDNAKRGFAPLLQRLGQAASSPFMPKTREKQSTLRKQLGMAGIYNPQALKVVTGAKVILLCTLLAGAYGASYVLDTTFNTTVLMVSIGGLIGYIGPTMWLKMKIKSNQQALTYGLPDALDLMVVCVESGLTVTAPCSESVVNFASRIRPFPGNSHSRTWKRVSVCLVQSRCETSAIAPDAPV